jgi:hypothetical protein
VSRYVNVRRVGSAAGEISFHWYTFGDSAHAGQDYLFGTGQISMVRRQTTAVLEIPIVADAVPENPELLQVVIANSRGTHVGAAGRVPVIIVDDE